MTPTSLFNRYLWLVELLSYTHGLSKSEIDARWEKSSLNNNPNEKEIPRRTFIRMKEAIAALFDLHIKYNRSDDKYYIEEGFTNRNKNTRNFLLSAFAVNHLVSENRDLGERIILENTPAGSTIFLSEITTAMRENHRLLITYQSYDMQEARTFEIAPYALRYFGRRWYVLAYTDFHAALRLYALDRIQAVRVTDTPFQLPSDFSAQHYFSRYFGVMMREGDVETVCLHTTATRAKYLRSLPLHHSQKEIEPNLFECRLIPAEDFINALRAMGPEVEVVSPAWIRTKFLKEAKELVTKYRKKKL